MASPSTPPAATLLVSPEVDSPAPSPARDAPVAPASDAPQTRVPWYRRRWCRVLAARVVLRLCMLGFLVLIGLLFSVDAIVDGYTDWIDSFPSRTAAVATYTAMACVFAGVAPGSYAPLALAGATFGILVGWGVGYVVMNVGSLLNLITVRLLLRNCCTRRCHTRLQRLNFDSLELLFESEPVRTVALMRLPVIMSGLMNYMFSLSAVMRPLPLLLGNLIGFVPGTLLFSVLGAEGASVAGAILDGDTGDRSFAVAVTVMVLCVASVLLLAVLVRRAIRRVQGVSDGTDGGAADGVPLTPLDGDGSDGGCGLAGGARAELGALNHGGGGPPTGGVELALQPLRANGGGPGCAAATAEGQVATPTSAVTAASTAAAPSSGAPPSAPTAV